MVCLLCNVFASSLRSCAFLVVPASRTCRWLLNMSMMFFEYCACFCAYSALSLSSYLLMRSLSYKYI